MAFQSVTKDPNAVLDYQFDWSDWLADGDTLSASTWTPASGITVDSSARTTTTATVWLSGGTAGQVYEVVNHVTTVDGRQDDRTLRVRVRQG
jgi:hypothetical protein